MNMRYIVPKPKRLVSIASLQHHVVNDELSSQWWIHNQHLHSSSPSSSSKKINNTSKDQSLYMYKSSDPIPISTKNTKNDNNKSLINSAISF